MTQEARPTGPEEAADPREILATLRPQAYGNRRPQKIRDPLVEPLWVGVRTLAAVDAGGAILVDADGDPVPGMAAIVDALRESLQARRRRARWLPDQADGARRRPSSSGPTRCPRSERLVGLRNNRAMDTVASRKTRWPRARSSRRRRSASSPPTCCGSTTRRFSTSRCWSGGACSKSAIAESDVRPGRRIRSSADRFVGHLVARAGLRRPDLQGGQQPLPAGRAEPRLGHHGGCRAAEGWYGWADAPNRADTGHPRRDRAARPGRHHGRHPEFQERRDDRLRGARRAGRARPVLPGPPSRGRQLGRRLARRDRPRRGRDRAARLHRADPPRPPDEQARAGEPDLPRDRRRRRQGRGAAHDLRDRRCAPGPGAGRRRFGPALDRARVDRAAGRADPQGRLRLRGAAVRPLQVRRDHHQHRHLPADPGALRAPHPPADRRRLRGVAATSSSTTCRSTTGRPRSAGSASTSG